MDEQRIIAVIKGIIPSVVSIAILKHESATHGTPHAGRRRAPVLPVIEGNDMVDVGGGSGFIVEPGLILTNKHVISDPDATYEVLTNDGTKHRAEVIVRDPLTDIAILKIPGDEFPTIPLGDATTLELGETVIAIGNALGIFNNTVSLGIVSGLSRAITAQSDPNAPPQELRGLIQTDAAINPGNSGGPLVTLDGRAVGINAAIVSGAQNIGLAIPINAAKHDLADLKHYGRVRRPFLGIRYIIIDESIQRELGLPVDYGALVIRETPRDHAVIVGSPAHAAGILEHDIIVACNDKKIDRVHSIQDVLENAVVGETLQLSMLRKDRQMTLSLILTERK